MTSYKYGNLPDNVNLNDIRDKMVDTDYIYRGTLTICIVTMRNGFKATGISACVDNNVYSKAKGEAIAFANAIDKLYELEGYLLAEQRYLHVSQLAPNYSKHFFDTDRNKPIEPVHDWRVEL